MRKRFAGFTLIELLVVVVLMALLVRVAYPAFTESLRKSRRVEAKEALMQAQMAQERYRGNNATYAADFATLGAGLASSRNGYYTLTITSASATATDYLITATPNPNSAQSGDASKCDNLYITAKGFMPAASDTKSCWGLR